MSTNDTNMHVEHSLVHIGYERNEFPARQLGVEYPDSIPSHSDL